MQAGERNPVRSVRSGHDNAIRPRPGHGDTGPARAAIEDSRRPRFGRDRHRFDERRLRQRLRDVHQHVDRPGKRNRLGAALSHALAVREPDGGKTGRGDALDGRLADVVAHHVARGDETDCIGKPRALHQPADAGDGIHGRRQVRVSDFEPDHSPGNLESRLGDRPGEHRLRRIERRKQMRRLAGQRERQGQGGSARVLMDRKIGAGTIGRIALRVKQRTFRGDTRRLRPRAPFT